MIISGNPARIIRPGSVGYSLAGGILPKAREKTDEVSGLLPRLFESYTGTVIKYTPHITFNDLYTDWQDG